MYQLYASCHTIYIQCLAYSFLFHFRYRTQLCTVHYGDTPNENNDTINKYLRILLPGYYYNNIISNIIVLHQQDDEPRAPWTICIPRGATWEEYMGATWSASSLCISLHPAFSEEDMDAMRHEEACADDAIAAHEDKAWADHAISEDQAAIQAAIDANLEPQPDPSHKRPRPAHYDHQPSHTVRMPAWPSDSCFTNTYDQQPGELQAACAGELGSPDFIWSRTLPPDRAAAIRRLALSTFLQQRLAPGDPARDWHTDLIEVAGGYVDGGLAGRAIVTHRRLLRLLFAELGRAVTALRPPELRAAVEALLHVPDWAGPAWMETTVRVQEAGLLLERRAGRVEDGQAGGRQGVRGAGGLALGEHGGGGGDNVARR